MLEKEPSLMRSERWGKLAGVYLQPICLRLIEMKVLLALKKYDIYLHFRTTIQLNIPEITMKQQCIHKKINELNWRQGKVFSFPC